MKSDKALPETDPQHLHYNQRSPAADPDTTVPSPPPRYDRDWSGEPDGSGC